MAYYDLANYCDSAQYTAVAQWAATTVYTVGNIRRPLTVPAVGNERCYVCTAPGTSGSTEPVWTFTRGAIQPSDGPCRAEWRLDQHAELGCSQGGCYRGHAWCVDQERRGEYLLYLHHGRNDGSVGADVEYDSWCDHR